MNDYCTINQWVLNSDLLLLFITVLLLLNEQCDYDCFIQIK